MKNHFEIGDSGAPFEKGSCYTRDMQKFDSEIYRRGASQINQGRDKRSNWNFGEYGDVWATEAKSR
jgi:hypothetical protein